MDENSLTSVNKQVWKQFPYLKTIQPQVNQVNENTFRLKYTGSAKTANDHVIPLIVTVTALSDGHITKINSSR